MDASMTPDGVKLYVFSIVFSALARTAWSDLTGLRVSLAGANSMKIGPNPASPPPPPSLKVDGAARKAPMSNWMSEKLGAARAGGTGVITNFSNSRAREGRRARGPLLGARRLMQRL